MERPHLHHLIDHRHPGHTGTEQPDVSEEEQELAAQAFYRLAKTPEYRAAVERERAEWEANRKR